MGFWSDLLDRGGQLLDAEIKNVANDAASQGIDHIPVQNETTARFAQISNAYNAGQLTPQQAIAEIQKWDRAFTVFAQQLNTSRAMRGAGDVHNLAVRIINSLGGGVVGPQPPGGGGIQIPGLGQVDTSTAVIIAIAAFFLLRKR